VVMTSALLKPNIIAHLPQLRGFPYPVQLLIVNEMDRAEEADDEGVQPQVGLTNEISCTCLFWRRWQLPSHHILQHHMIFGHLTDEVWAHWRWNWEENGFEIYETAETEYINQEMYQQIGAPVRRRLDVREIVDSLMNRYYGLEEELEYANEAERDLVIRFWIDELDRTVGPVRRRAADEIISRLAPERQQALHESQAAWSQRINRLPEVPEEPLVGATDDEEVNESDSSEQ
jgi:hypothetical protein